LEDKYQINKICLGFLIMKTLLLFDVDGTLTKPMNPITNEMLEELRRVASKKNIDIGFVGGSDYNKQLKQIGEENMDIFLWKFSENGLYAMKENTLFHQRKITEQLGETNYKRLVNTCLREIADIDIPMKRGTFLELRSGVLNVSPIGRACSQKEREDFYEYDKMFNVRKQLVEKLKDELWDLNLSFSIGGMVSIDVFPEGWDKTYCLQFVQSEYTKIYFFGDKTEPQGNDHTIFLDPRTIGVAVNSYHDTIRYLTRHF
jgi:phosphomannomutase